MALVAEGRSLNAVSRATGISRAALRAWRTHGIEPVRTGPEPLRTDGPGLADACEAAIRAVRPDGAVCRVPQQGCARNISVARRAAVALMDLRVGPKY